MEKRFAFFLGCTIPASQFHVEAAARKSFEKLGVELVDMEGATCCSDPEISRQFDENLWIHIAARNISIAEKLNANIMTICNGCFDTLNKVNESLKNDKELKDKVNRDLQTIGREFKGTVEVLHAIEVLHDEIGLDTISKAVVKPLKNLRVALQPGCRLYHDEEKRLVEMFEALV
nr:heterodisulfide reductase-related iron-sulfur binding cluster [Candidatus Baldrarchaeota archaeon]